MSLCVWFLETRSLSLTSFTRSSHRGATCCTPVRCKLDLKLLHEVMHRNHAFSLSTLAAAISPGDVLFRTVIGIHSVISAIMHGGHADEVHDRLYDMIEELCAP